MTVDEYIDEKCRQEADDERRLKVFHLKATFTQYGTIDMKAHSLEEAIEFAADEDWEKFEVQDYDWECVEDVE